MVAHGPTVGELRGGFSLRREVVLTALVTLAVATVLLAVGPAPGDAPAHLYRTFLLRHSSFVWDNLWYGGQYPFASYSLLYYLPAAIFGNLALAVFSSVVSAPLFVVIAYDEWGSVSRWPGRAFALLAAAPVFTGLYSYSLGFVAALAALRLLQRRRPRLGLVFAALTLGFSPLAFVFLCLFVAAAFLADRRPLARRHVAVALALGAIASVQVVALVLFPSKGVYPFNHWDLLALVTLCALGIQLARKAPQGRFMVAFFALWGTGAIVTFAIPSQLGDNVTRLRAFVFPLMLVTAMQTRFRPRRLVAVALAGALAYNVVPYLMLIPYRLDNRPASAAFWRPTLAFLDRHRSPDYRVEVVPTAAHWESYWVPRAGFALARGWYRQLDMIDNPELYRNPLTPALYREWLHRMAVRYVVLPHTTLDFDGGPSEAALLPDPRLGLRVVYRGATATIYRVPHASPLLAGGRVTALTHDTVSGALPRAGRYVLRLHYSPYWTVTPRHAVCLAKAAGDTTLIRVTRPTRFVLSMPQGLGTLVTAIARTADGGTCG